VTTKKQQKSTKGDGPSLRARWLGKLLKEYRNQNGLTLDKVGEFLEHDGSTISRIESAEYVIRRADLMVLLEFYKIPVQREREALLQLREDAWKQGWWDAYEEAFYDQNFVDYPWLESRAAAIATYEPQIVPGLMQTAEYAEAMMRCVEGPGIPQSQLASGVEARLARQQARNGEDAPPYTALVDESALRRVVGSREIMRAQLLQLVKMAEASTIELRVVPFSAGEHASMLGAFTLFEMADPYPDVAYVESMAGRVFVEDAARLDRIRRAVAELQESALDAGESSERISAIAEET
jgi:transcriptional regulator with XRE-family HTH domain